MLDTAHWQPVLDAHATLFADLAQGVAVGFIAKPDWDRGTGTVLEWRASEGRMAATAQPWRGAAKSDHDLLFIGLRDAFDRLAAEDADQRLSLLKDLVHEGEVLFFVMKTKCILIDSGWEDFLDCLGLAFMGACR